MTIYYFIIPIITIACASLGSFVTGLGLDWYKTLKLPAFTPLGQTIGLVWTIIFILTAIAVIVALGKSQKDGKTLIFYVFLANMALNFFWSFLFFYWHEINLAFWECLALELSVLFMIVLAWPYSRLAAVLLMPYAAWVGFASYLTYLILNLNRQT